jgi:hypothetical protein
MRQQVNLYQPSGGARAGELAPFAAATAVLLAAAVCAGLLGFWGFGIWRVDRLERALQTLRLEQQRQNETLAALGAARAAGVSPEQLDATIKSLTAMLDTHARALALLEQGTEGQVTGFSARLTALARRPIEGLWLDHVVLSGLNGAMSVGGSALDPDLVPRYFRGLGAERALAGIRFDNFVIERPTVRAAAATQTAAMPSDATATAVTPAADSSASRPFTFRAESGSLRTAGADARS